MTTIVVAGALANKAGNGGEAWVRLSWADGFRRLGARVHLVELIRPEVCRDATGAVVDVEESVNLEYFRAVTRRHGVDATLLAPDGRTFGASPGELAAIADDAALLVNVSGHLRRPDLLGCFRRTAYVDIDPGFTQLWHAAGYDLGIAEHSVHFTIGENIGQPCCSLPTGGIDWLTTRQPVVLDDWPPMARAHRTRLTTVGSWRGAYAPVEHEGRTFGVKAHEFRRFRDLPAHVSQRLEVALDIHPDDAADRERLEQSGWVLVDPARCAGDPDRFRSYVQGSAGEFSVAQGVYVASRCGWFSDRSVRYLASGRPVLVQDTAFAPDLVADGGVVPFSSFADAVAGARAIADEYDAHAVASRRVAERAFDAAVVLPRFLEAAGVAV
jgi:hypothetical protein